MEHFKALSFKLLVAEIHHQVYRYLLTTPAAITKPGSLVRRPIYIGVDKRRVTGLDARILRVSRQIYIEALPVLYSDNVFAFRNFDCLKEFQSKGLAPAYTTYLGRLTRNPIFIDSTYFGLKNNPDGRLTLIHHVEIHFKEGENSNILESENSRTKLDWRRDSIKLGQIRLYQGSRNEFGAGSIAKIEMEGKIDRSRTSGMMNRDEIDKATDNPEEVTYVQDKINAELQQGVHNGIYAAIHIQPSRPG
ncbi:MAG: hypothetical protein Q9221_007649 [Calogaya cf. arnoldii]